MASALMRPGQGERLPEEALEVIFIGEDRGLAELYRLRLELDGYWVTLSQSVDAGLENFRHRLPDIVFLDLGDGNRMKTDALQALHQRTAWQDVPVVLLWRGDFDAVDAIDFHLGKQDFIVRVDTIPSEEFWSDRSDGLLSPAAEVVSDTAARAATPRRSRRLALTPRPSASS